MTYAEFPISWNFAGDHSMACRKIPPSWIFLPCSLSTARQGACNGFEAQWNFSGTSTWAIDPDSFEQVGCIYTSQGLEFDYCGVIIGLDLRYEGGKVIADPTKNPIFEKGSISLRRHDYQKYLQDFINPWAKRMLYLLRRPKPRGLFGETRGQKGVTNFNLPSCSCFSLLFTKSGPLTVFCKYERVSIYKKWYCCQNM